MLTWGVDELLRYSLDQEPDLCVVLDGEGCIQFVNTAWRAESERMRSPAVDAERVLGLRYVDGVAGEIRHRIQQCLDEVLAGRASYGVTLHSECNTASQLRHLSSYFSPLRDPQEQIAGVIVRHQIRVEGALGDRYEVVEAAPDELRDARGLLTQCSCCRRVRDGRDGKWRVVVALMERPVPNTSHGYCETCLSTYYRLEYCAPP